jgi:predicted KAP-like P-loop ATPase
LAVGIFGEWGEGKSHFMQLLRGEVGRVDTAAQEHDANESALNPLKYSHIRQVRFNAWHYSETDLWASLVSEIFSQLASGEDQTKGLAGEQRQQSRLLSEIVAERKLPERIAAEKARRDELEAAARTTESLAGLSKKQKSEFKAAMENVDP